MDTFEGAGRRHVPSRLALIVPTGSTRASADMVVRCLPVNRMTIQVLSYGDTDARAPQTDRAKPVKKPEGEDGLFEFVHGTTVASRWNVAFSVTV